MARDYRVPIDLHQLELRQPVLHLLGSAPGSPVEGQLFYNTGSHVVEFYNGSAWIVLGTLDQITAPAADVSLNSHKITNLATPGSSGDAATKGYVDGLISGVSSWKTAVRAATTANGTLASAFANGQTIDGVTLVTGDRILLKNQTTASQNGIYTVNASGAPTRATDADAGTELLGAAVWVDEGTANADTGWVQTVDGTITVDTTSLTFVQFSGLGQVTAGNGLTKSGATLDVGAGTGIAVAADAVGIDPTLVPTAFAADIGDGSTTSIVVTHNLGSKDVVVAVYDKTTPFAEQYPEIRHTSTTTVTLVFAVAPTSAQYRAVVMCLHG